MAPAAIEWGALVEVMWVSLLSGVGVMMLFSLVVFGSSRVTEARREGANPAAFGALALVCSAALVVIVVYALSVILNKS